MSDSLRPCELWPARLLCLWGISRQEYWSGLPGPPPGDLRNPGIEPRSPALQVDSLLSEPPERPGGINNIGFCVLTQKPCVFFSINKVITGQLIHVKLETFHSSHFVIPSKSFLINSVFISYNYNFSLSKCALKRESFKMQSLLTSLLLKLRNNIKFTVSY